MVTPLNDTSTAPTCTVLYQQYQQQHMPIVVSLCLLGLFKAHVELHSHLYSEGMDDVLF